MKKLLVLFLILSATAQAQFIANSTASSTLVGIGIAYPQANLDVYGTVHSLGALQLNNYRNKEGAQIGFLNAIDSTQFAACLYYTWDTSIHILGGYCAKFMVAQDTQDYNDHTCAIMAAGDQYGNECLNSLCGETKKMILSLPGFQHYSYSYQDTSFWSIGSQRVGVDTAPVSIISLDLLNQKFRITDGSQSEGYVLTSDSNGVASWRAPTPSGATGSEPISPILGQFYMDTTLTKMKFWNGTVWAVITSTP